MPIKKVRFSRTFFEVGLALYWQVKSLRFAPTHRFLRVCQGEKGKSVKYKTFAKINFNHLPKNVSSVYF